MSEEYNERSLGDEIADEAESQAKGFIKREIEDAVRRETAQTAGEAVASGAGAEASALASESAGATAGATGATATATEAGATAGASATAGAGASAGGASAGAAGGPIGLIIAAIFLALKKLGDEAKDAFDPERSKNMPEAGPIAMIGFGIIIVCMFLFPGLFVSNGYGAAAVKPDEGVQFYKVEDLDGDKQALFDRIFNEYGITQDDIFKCDNLYKESNEKNFAVCKEIIDYAIYKAFTDEEDGFVVSFIHNTLIDRLGAQFRALFEGPGEELTRQSFFSSRYPYCLNYYTVSDYLGGNIPENELNDDLNYAEVLSVIELNEEMTGTKFTFSNFYDIVCDPNMRSHFAEIDYSELKFFVGYNTERIFSSEEEAQAWIDANKPVYNIIDDVIDGVTDPTDEKTKKDKDKEDDDDEDGLDIEDKDEILPEDYDPENWFIHCFADIKTYPYGLVELYDLAKVTYYERCANLPSLHNYEMMDEYEKNMRLLADEYIEFGTGFEESRDPRSLVKDKAPTGRSAYCYIDEDKLMFTLFMNIPDWDYDDPVRWDIVHVPTDDCVLLDMDMWYECQLGNYNKRGNTNSSINAKGCIDCAYTMCVEYLLNKNINVNAVSATYVNDDGNFNTPAFLSGFGISREMHKGAISETGIRDSINQGLPVVVGLNGYWSYNNKTYHNNSSTHFIVVSGYDPTGFYVLDPASPSNSQEVIPYEAWDYVSTYTWSSVGGTNSDAKFK